MNLQQSKQVFEMPHLLTYYECDDTGHPSLSMVLSMMSMVSDAHSSFLGMDTATIQATGGGWVITGYEGEFSPKQPTFGDRVILGTRAVSYNRFFALREFWMTDPNHQVRYAHFHAIFVFMNLKKRRLMSIPQKLITRFDSPLKNQVPRLKRIEKITTEHSHEQTYRVRYFDIDVNHHVNNARYFDWLLDPLGGQFLRTHQLVRMVIKYQREVRENSMVTSRFQVIRAADRLTSRHEIVVAGQKCTIAEFQWINR